MVLEQCRQADSFAEWVPHTLGPSHPCCVGPGSLPPWVPPTPAVWVPPNPVVWVPPTLGPSHPGFLLPWVPHTLDPSHPLPSLLCRPVSLPPRVPPTPRSLPPPSHPRNCPLKHLTKIEIFANCCILSYISVQSKCRHQNWTCQFPHIWKYSLLLQSTRTCWNSLVVRITECLRGCIVSHAEPVVFRELRHTKNLYY